MDEIHARVGQRLELLGPGPAAFFRDAYLVLTEVRAGRWVLPTASHVVAHLLRELESAVREVLYAQLVGPPPPVTAEPPRDDSPEAEALREPSGPARQLDGTGSQGTGARQRDEIKAILAALDFTEDGPEAREWLRFGPGDDALHLVTHRNALSAPRPVDERITATFAAMTRTFDAVLDRFAARYAAVYDQLDALLALKTPTKADVQRLRQKLPNTPRTLGYFFERLSHPGWLGPLAKKGFFSAPPPPIVGTDQVAGGYSHWFAADYLLRMAPERPNEVADILAKVPSTENIRVHAQLIEVALALRPVDRAAMSQRVEEWVAGFGQRYWGDQPPRFALALLHDGEVALSLSLAERLVDLPRDWRAGIEPGAAAVGSARERPWYLREAAETLFPALCSAAPVRTIELLAAALDLHAGRRALDSDVEHPAGLVDYSELWAHDLGESEQYDASELRALLIHMLRRALQQVGAEAPANLGDAVAMLRKHRARVIRRVEMAALADLLLSEDMLVRDAALPLALLRLCTSAVLAESSMNTEVVSLLRAAFPHATPADRQHILDAMVAPTFHWLADEHVPSRRARWRRDRLALVEEHLPPRERGELLALSRSVGDPEPVVEAGARFSAGFVGVPSPLDEATLRGMSVEETVGFLSTWRARGGIDEPSQRGLAATITTVLRSDPAAYAAWAPAFIGQHPAYISALLEGFRMAARDGKHVPWREVLTLMTWLVDQPAPTDDMMDGDSDERARGDARRHAADLAGLALGAVGDKAHRAPFEERDCLWNIVSVLAEDVNPSTGYEERWNGANGDPADLAINTVRPQAIDAAIWFAFWSAGHQGDGKSLPQGVLVQEPAVADLLVRHLNPDIDSSVAVRAAIGRWMPWLARTDAAWMTAHERMLFPPAPEHIELREALWNSYVIWTRPHSNGLEVLAPEYRAAIDRMGTHGGDAAARPRNRERADDHLAEHLVMLYWWGSIPLEDPDSLIALFFARADGSHRAHALQYVGRSLLNTVGPVDPAVLERLRLLWEWRARTFEPAPRVGDAGTSGADPSVGETGSASADARKEALQFGLWFASGAFESDWALTQLDEALRVAGNVEWSSRVAERLAVMANREPARAAACLLRVDFARSDDMWAHQRWLKHLPAILGPALASTEPTVVAVAHEVVHRVVAAGYTEHRVLLRPSPEPPPPASAT